MASTTSFTGLRVHPSNVNRANVFSQPPLSLNLQGKGSTAFKTLNSLKLKTTEAIKKKESDLFIASRVERSGRSSTSFRVRCADATSERITQQEFTDMAWQGIVSAPEVAKENKHQIVETEHLLKALLEQKNGLARRIFSKARFNNTRLLEATDKFIQRQPKVLSEPGGSVIGRDFEAVIRRARDYKKEYGDSFVSVEHLVLGFMEDKRFGKQLFNDFNISLNTLRNAIQAIRGPQKANDQDAEGKYEALEKYGIDLTSMAREGKLDPVVGRDDEIRRCIQILCRRTKNNPVLIGVGKTELAKALASYLFNTEQALIRIDMSEYMERHAVSRLIGAPPGYVGYEEGGQLTEKVRRRPYSVILFDEIEKAHSDVFNVLLQILDDGRVTDSHGRTVSFTNTIIIMTSNVGSQYILNMYDENLPKEQAYEIIKQRVLEAARSVFRPEFMNRVDEYIVFKPLDCEEINQIVRLQLERVQERLAYRKIKIQVTDAAVQFLGELGYDPNYGARPVKRAIQQYIENELAKGILRGEYKEEDTVLIDAEGTAYSDGQPPQKKLVFRRLGPDSDASAVENREVLSQTQ